MVAASAILGCQETPKAKFLALGDSYTIGEGVLESDRWPQKLIERLRASGAMWDEPKYVAQTGWTTDELAEGVRSAKLTPPYDLVSLSIGVNNQFRKRSASNYRQEFEGLLTTAIRLAGGKSSRVFVVSIPDYSASRFATPEDPKIVRKELDEFNLIASEICAKHGVEFVDVTSASRRKERFWFASDGLHPAAYQYAAWVETIATALEKDVARPASSDIGQ